MFFDIVIRPEFCAHRINHHLFNFGRKATTEFVQLLLSCCIFNSRQRISNSLRIQPSHSFCKRINRRSRNYICRRALQHRDLCNIFSHGGHERHRRCTRTNNNDTLVAIIKILRPELRVHHCAVEVLNAFKLRCEALLVAVVARAHE